MCPHFARGNCKFGKDCKKSHDTSGANGHSGSTSNQAKRVTGHLNDLFAYLHSVDQMSPREFERGSIVDDMALDIENLVAALQQAVTFTSGHDLLHTNFIHDRVQNMTANFLRTWKNVAGGILMNTKLTGALLTLDQTIGGARQKINQVQINRPGTNFSNDNVFQQGGGEQQGNQNVSNQNGGRKDQKGGKNGRNNNNDNKNNRNNAKNGKKGQNGQNGNDFNPVKKTGNQFQPSGVAAAFKALGMIGNRTIAQQYGNAQRGQGRGKRGGRRGQ